MVRFFPDDGNRTAFANAQLSQHHNTRIFLQLSFVRKHRQGGLLYLRNLDFASVIRLSLDRDRLIERRPADVPGTVMRYLPSADSGRAGGCMALDSLGTHTFLGPSHVERVYFEYLVKPDCQAIGLPQDMPLSDYAAVSLPVTERVNCEMLKLPSFPHASTGLLDQYIHAFEKVIRHAGAINRQAAKTA